MTWSGNGIDSVGTMSTTCPLSICSTSACAFAVTPASISRTSEGLNPGWTRRR